MLNLNNFTFRVWLELESWNKNVYVRAQQIADIAMETSDPFRL